MKTAELIGPALDWAVAKCEGLLERGSAPLGAAVCKISGGRVILTFYAHDDNEYEPSTYWSQGGPIIERENISVNRMFCDGKPYCWAANTHDLEYDEIGEFIEGSDHAMDGPTPLVAAMRCYVASKLGGEVEIPEELL
jgi:hypothetical protein